MNLNTEGLFKGHITREIQSDIHALFFINIALVDKLYVQTERKR
jgi:hypothetical protein